MRRPKGFTLIELLVVISIIALLVSILMPALSQARNQAKAIVCLSNIKQWGMITGLYANDNNDKLYQSVAGGGVSGQNAYWITASLPYYGTKDIRLCPSTKIITRQENRTYGKTFEAWGPFSTGTENDWWGDFDTGSYGLNEWCACPPTDGGDTYWGFPKKNAWKNTSARGGNNIPMFLDCAYVDAFPRETDAPPEMPDENDGWGSNGMKLFCMDRHIGGVNAAFLDLSARKVNLKGLWGLKWHKNYSINNIHTGDSAIWPDWMDNLPD